MGKIIDISKWQGNISFDKVKQDGVVLVIARTQYGSTTIDKNYKGYVDSMKRIGLNFGSYAYARFVSKNDARIEAKNFLARADKDSKFLVVDVEENTVTSSESVWECTQAYIDYLKENDPYKRKVGLYTGHHFFKPFQMDKVKNYDFLWIPRYASDGASMINPDFPCDIHQYTDKGKVDGIAGNVDMNRLMGSKPLDFYIGKTATVTKPSPAQPKVDEKVNSVTYTVKSGDNLTAVANKYKTTISAIMKLNPSIKDADEIKVGQVIKVSGTAPKTTPAPKEVYHTVKNGETVSELAKQFGTTQTNIKNWNKLDSKYTIYVGQKLRVK